MAEEGHVEPGMNVDVPQAAWTDSPEVVMLGFDIGDSATTPAADAANLNLEAFEAQTKRSVPRQQQQRARQRLI